MSVNKNLLLSFIIPTKNRSYTLMYAIQSVLRIDANDIEIIVQDCSDTDDLREKITVSYMGDPRVKYFYSSDSPSLTENWNRALYNSRGKFICGIGDDDAVFPEIYKVCKWMDEREITAALSINITYVWPDAFKEKFSNSRIFFPRVITGKIYCSDVMFHFERKIRSCGFGYTENLPNIYHGIIRASKLREIRNSNGYYLSGTSFDVYNAFALSAFIKTLYFIDYPLTLRGISASSNSSRIVSKTSHMHFHEFKEINYPDVLPLIFNSETSIAESMIKALSDLDLFNKYEMSINYSVLYGKLAVYYPEKISIVLKKYFKLGYNNSTMHLVKFYFIFLIQKYQHEFKMKIARHLFLFSEKHFRLLYSKINKLWPKAQNIIDSIEIIENHFKSKQISISFDNIPENLKVKKDIWD